MIISAEIRTPLVAGALAVLVLLADVVPASAQQQLAAVVCVGSELETLAGTGPMRSAVRRDTELVYRVGVNLADQAQVERSVTAELGTASEVSCAWSSAGQNHLIVVSYQGVVRGDLTIDPEDPRYQSFSVGYGTDWEEAEQFATRVNDRFATNYDGSGYEVLVRETWGVGGAGAADTGVGAGAPEPDTGVGAGAPEPDTGVGAGAPEPDTGVGAGAPEPDTGVGAGAPEPGTGVGAGAPEPGTGVGAGAPEPGTVFRDCDACPEMVVVPPGSFMMGSPASEAGRFDSEGPQHRVTIDYPLAVGVYEVTFAEWDACVAAGVCYRPNDAGWGRGRRPVMNVAWEFTQRYVEWLSGETGEEYRLLSEAEWEYVARAGTRTAQHWGASSSGRCRYANGYDGVRRRSREPVSCSDGFAETAPVGSFEPNAFGLYDVLGNVSEWTDDCGNESYVGAPTDGSPWASGVCSRLPEYASERVYRGGSWADYLDNLRLANRFRFSTEGERWKRYIGFRLARTIN